MATVSPTRSTQRRGQLKQCEICGRSFTRTEHLIRHRRTHTNEKPFRCDSCHSTFPRSDVQARHSRKCQPKGLDGLDAMDSAYSRRSKLACDNCHDRKLKCRGGEPCESCQMKKQVCVFSRRPSSGQGDNVHETQTITVGTSHRSESGSSIARVGAQNAPQSILLDPITPSSLGDLQFANVGLEEQLHGTTFESSLHLPTTSHSQPVPASHEEVPVIGSWLEPLPAFLDADIDADMWSTAGAVYDMWPDEMSFPFLEDASMMDAAVAPVNFWGDSSYDFPNNPANSASDRALSIMQRYYQHRSERSSPRPEKDQQVWFQSSGSPQVYDRDTINVLLNTFQRHLSSSFPMFADFTVYADMRQELYLAMAAVGALFCDVWGSYIIAKALYNNARRKLFDFKHEKKCPSNLERLSIIKTSILLEIYGICSGDKRSYEFVEVYHMDMLQEVTQYELHRGGSSQSADELSQRRLLFESLYLLESYHIVILQRSPSIQLTQFEPLHTEDDTTYPLRHVRDVVARLFDPSAYVDPAAVSTTNSFATLAAIATYARPALLRSNENGCETSLWRTEFVELALDRWIKAQSEDLDISILVFFHMTHIGLHANIKLLQCFAHAPAGSPARGSTNSIVGSLKQWAASHDYKTAAWHSEVLLQHAKRRLVEGSNRRARTSTVQSLLSETPQLPVGIYFACLVLWSGSVVTQDVDPVRATAVVELGIQILSGFKIRIAELLRNVLREFSI